ncbi:MAG: response regulator, partial [Pseudomonadota bacterium]|nr:response regulator [Pseudomonadota bacterium]
GWKADIQPMLVWKGRWHASGLEAIAPVVRSFLLTEPLRQRAWAGYLVAVLLSLAALGIRFALGDRLTGFPFLTFYPAVLAAAFAGGRGPGLLAAALSGALAWYFLVAPVNAFGFSSIGDVLAIGLYVFVTVTLVLLVHGMNRAYGLLLRSEGERAKLNAELERRVEDRTSELLETTERLRAEIAARAEAEARVAQMQRLEAVGQLTGGIAHDFNNMLAIVIGNLDLAQRRIARGMTDVGRFIENSREGAKRGATLTQRLLAFGRRQPLSPEPLNVNALVHGMSELLRHSLGEEIEIETVLAGGLWRTYADATQLESAIVNLAVNARDAMPGGGKLTIETMNAHIDDAYAAANPDAVPGQYVVLAVSDTGEGMPKDVLDRSFEPFFTTKAVGHGTGLGLSQIYGYLKQSGGHAKIYSEVGRGTTVKLYFPRYMAAEEPARCEKALEPLLPAAAGAEETILVVEDEPGVRAMSVETLKELGYTVLEAENGPRAIETLERDGAVELLFTDVVMPGMTGRELAEEVKRRWPKVKVLYTTGYTRNAIVHGGRLDAGVSLLPKPYSAEELSRKVRAALDG